MSGLYTIGKMFSAVGLYAVLLSSSLIPFQMTFSQERDPCEAGLRVIDSETVTPYDSKTVTVQDVINAGHARMSNKDYDGSIRCWSLLLKAFPDTKGEIAIENRAACYQAKGDTQLYEMDMKALEIWRKG